MATKTKDTLKYPRVVGKLTAAEFKAFQDMEAIGDEATEGLDPMAMIFGELPEELQTARHHFWHMLYKAHKLDPQRDYHINEDELEIVQESGELDTETV